MDSIAILTSDNNITLTQSKEILRVEEPGRAIETPIKNVLWAEVEGNDTLHISLLRRKKKHLIPHHYKGTFPPKELERVKTWTITLFRAAYEGSRPQRRFMIIINPFGGPGKALSIFEKKLKPIFQAARCSFDVLVTERRGHCIDYVKDMKLGYDALCVLSGDGLVHEVFNAYAARADSEEAFRLPVIQIPTGSANGFSISLLGLKDGLNVSAATLNAIKGKPMKLDLCRMKQNGNEIISFMSQTIGMMADIDLKTEPMRWMGGTRFMVGFVAAVCVNRSCPIKLEIKVASRDKHAMLSTYRKLRSQSLASIGQSSEAELVDTVSPVLAEEEAEEEWTVVDKKLSYVCAGKLPYVSSDFMQFPIAACDDGLIDVVAQERTSRLTFLKGISGAEKGEPYWEPTAHYFKAKAYRLTPLASDGCFSVDGERYPYAPFEVEVLQRLGTTLGLGAWHPEFNIHPRSK